MGPRFHGDDNLLCREAMPHLTTHVLDTASGKPAAGMRVVMRREGAVIAEATTNADGRLDKPLLISPYGYSTYRGS